MIFLQTKNEILELLWENPIEVGHWVGFKQLSEINNDWLRMFLYSDDDQTLQAHRGSYKTTTLSLFFALHCIIRPNETIIYFRKTDGDVKEITRQTSNILHSGCMQKIAKILYGQEYRIEKESATEISTNLTTRIIGAPQLLGIGIGTSVTGKHADIVVTDDIINLKDRASEAERNRTKAFYQELQNIKNRGGREINTGTPWHKDDAFMLMPNIRRFDCYSTELISQGDIDELKTRMSPSLFAANYELKHIADSDVIFTQPAEGEAFKYVLNGFCHVDSAFYGSDYTAFTAVNEISGKFYMYGRIWRKHVNEVYDEIVQLYKDCRCKIMHMEMNADKGMVARDLKKLGVTVRTYHEDTNKHVKIVTNLKAIWKDVVFVEGTDRAYIEQILDYNEEAEHDDAPDSAACVAREILKHKKQLGTISKSMLGL